MTQVKAREEAAAATAARAAVVTAAAVEDTTRLHSTATLTVHQCSTTKSQYTNKCHNNKPNQHHTITHLRMESHKLTHAQLLMALSAPVMNLLRPPMRPMQPMRHRHTASLQLQQPLVTVQLQLVTVNLRQPACRQDTER